MHSLQSNVKPPAYVVLSGELDLFRKDEIRASLPDPAEVSSIVVNCARAVYMDSTVLGMLVGLRRRFVAAGGSPSSFILLVIKGSIVHRACELAGVTNLFAMAFIEQTVAKKGTIS